MNLVKISKMIIFVHFCSLLMLANFLGDGSVITYYQKTMAKLRLSKSLVVKWLIVFFIVF